MDLKKLDRAIIAITGTALVSFNAAAFVLPEGRMHVPEPHALEFGAADAVEIVADMRSALTFVSGAITAVSYPVPPRTV